MSEEPQERLQQARTLLVHTRKAMSRQFLRLQGGEATPEDEAAFVRLMEEVAEAGRVFDRTTREVLRGSPDEQEDRPLR